MDRFKKSDLKDLLAHQGQPQLSLYMPTHRVGSEIQQDPIRFKNLLGQAEDILKEQGLRAPEAQQLLEQARDQLLFNEAFWQQQSDGLALFIAPGLFQYFRLPLTFDETVIVANQFYVKPIFALFQNSGRFYILALSQNEVRLLEGTKHRVEAIDLEQVPPSLAEALKWDDPEKQTQYHTTTGERGGGREGRPRITLHGQGVGRDDEKTNILRFFQKVDKGLNEFLSGEQIPLVLAGVDYLFPIYQEANSYNHLVAHGISGNPEELSVETLHARAWELLGPVFQKHQEQAAALYRQQAGMGTGRASKDVREIVPAAYAGRVGQLFVRQGAEIWGKYDLDSNRVVVYPDRKPGSEDLLNTAAVFTFNNDGAIFVAHASGMPDQSPVAAIFRY